jgi:NAD+ diphosphatase
MDQIDSNRTCPSLIARETYFQRFQPSFTPQGTLSQPERWFIFNQNRILLKKNGDIPAIPTKTDFDGCKADFCKEQFIGEFDGSPCYCMEALTGESPNKNMSFEAIRSLVVLEDNRELFKIAGLAYHIANWSRLNTFCGRCGAPMQNKSDERAKICPQCGSVVYPRISPAIITAVIKGDRILLAHNKAFQAGLYSLIAGFVEPGETLEDCVKREIFEEIGIRIKNPRYIGSQPWPFPDSLMLAFIAEHESGEIKVDGVEIGDAKWFQRDELPLCPGTESIAGRILKWFREVKQGE